MATQPLDISKKDSRKLGYFLTHSNPDDWTELDQEDAKEYLEDLQVRQELRNRRGWAADEGIEGVIIVMEAVIHEGRAYLSEGVEQVTPRVKGRTRTPSSFERRRAQMKKRGIKMRSITLGGNIGVRHLEDWTRRFGAPAAARALLASALLSSPKEDDSARAGRVLAALPTEVHVTLLLHHAARGGAAGPTDAARGGAAAAAELADRLDHPRSTAILEHPRFASALQRVGQRLLEKKG